MTSLTLKHHTLFNNIIYHTSNSFVISFHTPKNGSNVNVKLSFPLVSIIHRKRMGGVEIQLFTFLTSAQGRHHPWLLYSLEKRTLLAKRKLVGPHSPFGHDKKYKYIPYS
jgi:hypothetical protein